MRENLELEIKNKEEGNIFEEEFLKSENFEIYYNSEIKEILEDGDEKKFDKTKEFVNRILGSKKDTKDEKSKIYLFSDEEKYSKFLEENFPNAPSGSATFDKETESVFIRVSILEKEKIDEYKDLLQKKEISKEEIKDIARANIFSGVGHEIGHLHPFFGGVENVKSKDKWEQEMICIFIGEKIGTDFGNEQFRKYQFETAQKELNDLKKEDENFSWEEVKNEWDNITMRERFVYPWLEKKYGLEKLQEFWKKMFKEKKTITEAAEDVYNEEIGKLEENFMEDMLKAKNYSVFEKSI